MRLQMVLALITIPQSYQTLVMYFVALNPSWAYTSVTHNIILPNKTFASTNKTRCSLERELWQYTTPKHYSMVTTYDLACGREWMIYLCTSLYFVGWGIGSLLFGWVSDKYGRKLARIEAKLRRTNIVKDLMGPCSTCKVPHTCLDPFRACPDAVLTWRTHVVP